MQAFLQIDRCDLELKESDVRLWQRMSLERDDYAFALMFCRAQDVYCLLQEVLLYEAIVTKSTTKELTKFHRS